MVQGKPIFKNLCYFLLLERLTQCSIGGGCVDSAQRKIKECLRSCLPRTFLPRKKSDKVWGRLEKPSDVCVWGPSVQQRGQEWERRTSREREGQGHGRTKSFGLKHGESCTLQTLEHSSEEKDLGVQNCHSEDQLLGTYCPWTPTDCYLEIQSAGTFSLFW